MTRGVRAKVDDSALRSSAGECLAWVDFKSRESGNVLFSSAKTADQLVHVHCLKQSMIQPLRLVAFVTTLVLLVPATRLPLTRTPTARFPVARTPLVTSLVFAPCVGPLVAIVILQAMCVPSIVPAVTVAMSVPGIVPAVMCQTSWERR